MKYMAVILIITGLIVFTLNLPQKDTVSIVSGFIIFISGIGLLIQRAVTKGK
jgi:uncharacterized membrane protein HdeD (DUF308 family)